MHLTRSVAIDRPPKDVFALVSDLERGPEWFVGITRWDPKSRRRTGVGARYRVLVQVGSIEAGSTLAVTEWKPGETIAWKSEDGIEQRGRWWLSAHGSGGTELRLEIEFSLPGGPGSRLAERLAGRVLARDMGATLLAARRILEFEERPASGGTGRAPARRSGGSGRAKTKNSGSGKRSSSSRRGSSSARGSGRARTGAAAG
ncbi:MAG: SRPBCC family protein [Actinomycetota bacterium]